MELKGYICDNKRDLIVYCKNDDYYSLFFLGIPRKEVFKIGALDIYVNETELEIVLKDFWRLDELAEQFEIRNMSEHMGLFEDRIEMFYGGSFEWTSKNFTQVDTATLRKAVNQIIDKSYENFVGHLEFKF